jgi:hypothetical protein
MKIKECKPSKIEANKSAKNRSLTDLPTQSKCKDEERDGYDVTVKPHQ